MILNIQRLLVSCCKVRKVSQRESIIIFKLLGDTARSERAAWTEGEVESLQRWTESKTHYILFFLLFLVNRPLLVVCPAVDALHTLCSPILGHLLLRCIYCFVCV